MRTGILRLAAAALLTAALPSVGISATANFNSGTGAGTTTWLFGLPAPDFKNENSRVDSDPVADITVWDGTGEFVFLSLEYYNAVNLSGPAPYVNSITFTFTEAELAYLRNDLFLTDMDNFTINFRVDTTTNEDCNPDPVLGCPDTLITEFVGLPDSVIVSGDLNLEVAEQKSAIGTLSIRAKLPPQCIEDCPPPPCLTDCGPPPPPPVSEVPLPASSLLLLGAVGGLLGLRRRKRG